MAGTGVGKFSSTAGNNTANMTVNFAENMAPSNVNNAARELMGHMRDMYEQLGDGYFEFGDGDGTYTVARSDADTITITSSSDISSVYFAGRKIRITDGGANVVEGTIASSSHSSTTQTVNLTGISLASGTPTKVELGIDTAAFGGRVILDDDGDTYIEAPTDDTIDIYVGGAKDFVITANTFTAESGSTIAAQALTATTVTASGIIKTDDATEATSTTDGSLQTDGGLSVVKDAVFGDDIKLLSDSAVIHFGADGDVTLTHDHNVGLILATEGVANSLAIVSGDDGATGGPTLNLKRDSASPADDDIIGIINFTGRNDNSQDVIGFQIDNFCRDVSDGAEENITRFKNMFNGTLTEFMRADSQSDQSVVTFNELSNDIDFRVEGNGQTHMLHVNAGDDSLHIADTGTEAHRLILQHDGSNEHIARFKHSDGTPEGLIIQFTGGAPDGSSANFLEFSDTGATRFIVQSDGDVQNHDNAYGAISDERIKEQIKDSSSQWDDIKAMKIRKYKMKDDVAAKGDSDALWRIGVIAQELEASGMNGLVKDEVLYEEGEPNMGDNKAGDMKNPKTVKYSILYMKAIKALQEAQTRIETLETKVTALEG